MQDTVSMKSVSYAHWPHCHISSALSMSFPSAYVYYLKGVSMEFKNRHCFNWVFEK